MTLSENTSSICELCKNRVGSTTRLHVAVKKTIMSVCDDCAASTITYPPGVFIDEGDVEIR